MIAEGGFTSAGDAEEFVDAGRGIVDALQEELGPSWHVEYMPEPVAPPGLRLARRGRRLARLRAKIRLKGEARGDRPQRW
jgi:hypothetical protein